MDIPVKELNNGIKIPQIGLGVYKVSTEQAYETVSNALKIGYRHIDTASFYGNEEEVGEAIRDSEIPREEIFVTTKVWNDNHGYDRAQKAFENSLAKFGLDYVDLYLIHWPVPTMYTETWKVLEKLYQEKAAKAIGVSNFLDHHLEEIANTSEITPVVDQIELHPKLMQKSTVDYCQNHGIKIESWSPLGRGRYLNDPVIANIAGRYQKSPAQIMIRWHVQHDFIVIPKSTNKDRQKENIGVFDFHLEDQDMKLLDQMDEGMRIGAHPDNPPL